MEKLQSFMHLQRKRVWKETHSMDMYYPEEELGKGERSGGLCFNLCTSEFFGSLSFLTQNKENEKTHVSNK